MRILGLDPGYAIVGFGALDFDGARLSPVQYGAITTRSHTQFEARLGEIYDDLAGLLSALQPDAVAMETLFYQNNKTTAFAVAEARGVLRLAAHKLPIKSKFIKKEEAAKPAETEELGGDEQ